MSVIEKILFEVVVFIVFTGIQVLIGIPIMLAGIVSLFFGNGLLTFGLHNCEWKV